MHADHGRRINGSPLDRRGGRRRRARRLVRIGALLDGHAGRGLLVLRGHALTARRVDVRRRIAPGRQQFEEPAAKAAGGDARWPGLRRRGDIGPDALNDEGIARPRRRGRHERQTARNEGDDCCDT